MIELIVIFSLAKRLGETLRSKNYKPLGYQVMFVIVWFASEIGVAIGGTLLLTEGSTCAVYILSIAGASLAAFLMFKWVESLPPNKAPNDFI